MGGRGTYAYGRNVAYIYRTVGKIDGVKILEPIDKTKSFNLPAEPHSSSNYILLNKSGIFRQYREYDSRHKLILEIGYHHENTLGEGNVLHVHIYSKPGVENHGIAEKRRLTRAEYDKYKNFFKGVIINEREYFKRVYK